MKEILFVIPTLRMGGAEKSLVTLLKAIDSTKYKVDLLLFEAGGPLQKEVPQWVNIIEADLVTRAMILEMRYYFKPLLKSGKLSAAFSRIKMTLDASLSSKLGFKKKFSWNTIKKHIPSLTKHYDVAVGCLEGFTDFYVIDKVVADRKIGWIHSDLANRYIFEQDIKYYNEFDELATISDVCLEAACKVFPGIEGKIQVVENIVLTSDVREKANVEITDEWEQKDVCHLVSVGRLEYHKGMDIAVRAAKLLVEKGCSFCWHIYGYGSMQDEIEKYIKENNLEKVFILEGLRENPYPYMKQADVLVQPSRLEGKSIVLDESKILGKAIVVTNYPSVSDQITDEVTGIITEISPESIADGIERFINDVELRKKLEYNCFNEPNKSEKAVDKFYNMVDA